jgi:hypothetical protein
VKITKQQLKEIVREELASLAEAKISPADKKQFHSDAQEILDNFIKAKLVDADTEFHVVKNSLRHVFSAIANGEGSANYNKVKKYLPKKLNNDLYDNGEKNSYDSVWFSMNDAQRETIFLKAIRAKKLNLSEDAINEDQYGDVSFSRRKLKLACEDSENILQLLADKAEDEELPNWWIDKVSKASDYLNVCRDYLATDGHTDAVHEGTEKEYPIWGIPPGKKDEELLYTKAKSHSQAKGIAKILTDKHKCKKVRIQVLDLAQDPADIWDAEKLFK